MTEILHAADLHLDTQPSELRAYPDLVGNVLRDASLRAFDALVDTAVERGVVACVFAGDIYDGAERGLRAQLRLREGLDRLSEAGIWSYLVHGNHDPVEEGWTAIRTWPDRVVVFEPGEPQTHQLPTEVGDLAIHGVSYATRATTDNLASRFRRTADAPVQIGVLHTNVGDQPGHAPYAPCSLDDLRAVGLDYWALGHVHTRQTLAGPHPWVVYPGNLQGRSPRRSEHGAKGAVVVSIEPGGIPRAPTFLPFDVVRFETLTVDVSDAADVGDVRDLLVEQAGTLRADSDGRSLVLRAELVGRVHWRSDLSRPGTLDELRDSVQSAGVEPFVWWDRITDRTAPAVDLDDAARNDDLLGHVLRALSAEGGALSEIDALFGDELPADLDRWGLAVPAVDDPALLDAARLLAFDLLTEENT
ncbi:MAG: DNA repair exonuclease [Acidimicrobiia bacterium]|nr:DNA repair exonuclease [Acidimicrobiia bacterium]